MLRVFDYSSTVQTLLGVNLLDIRAVRGLHLASGLLCPRIGEYITPATASKVCVFDCGSVTASCMSSSQ